MKEHAGKRKSPKLAPTAHSAAQAGNGKPAGASPSTETKLRDGNGLACTWLVIGYGNELRGDDAAGPCVARAIDDMRLPGVHVIARQQLTPELADQIAHVDGAIFIDAALDVSEVSVKEIACAERGDVVAHSNSPEVMLAFAKAAFGYAPRAWLISIPAKEIGFRSALSEETSRGASRAKREALRLIRG